MELLGLKKGLEPAIGDKEAIAKVQNILLPIETINLGNIVTLIIDIATTKATTATGGEGVGVTGEDNGGELPEPWTKAELIPYLKGASPYTRLLLAALSQVDKEPTRSKTVTFLMNEIAKRRPSEGINKEITGRDIAGARGGLHMRRKPLNKEDIIESSWSSEEQQYMYKIKSEYKQNVIDWVKSEVLWIKEEIG
ncbi:MAG: hypothetical protein ACLFUU_06860 [Desulfobacteraceae bacterium]